MQYKRQKEITRRIEVGRLRAIEIRSSIGQQEIGDVDDEQNEEVQRERTLLLLHLFAQRTVEHCRSIRLETQLLQNRPKVAGLPDSATALEVRSYLLLHSLISIFPLHFKIQGSHCASAPPLKPFVLLNKREQLRRQVFQPGHTLPTMTIEEYLEREMARGNFISQADTKQAKALTDELSDEAATRARKWDDFKDGNSDGAIYSITNSFSAR